MDTFRPTVNQTPPTHTNGQACRQDASCQASALGVHVDKQAIPALLARGRWPWVTKPCRDSV